MEKELAIGFYNTEPLWLNQQFGIPQFKFPRLDLSNYVAKPIPEKLRLGHKMEYVFEQLIQFSNQWELIAKNLLINRDKIRLGELDFILKNRETATLYHIELAYKFYIINPEISEPMHRLMGPNKRDMFYTKLDKLKEKQFPLLYSDELSKQLYSLEIDSKKVKQQSCFKTQLFTPYKNNTTSIRPLNKNCIQGSWIHFKNFNTAEFKDFEYYIPYKEEWAFTPSIKRTYASHYKILLDINLRMLKERTPMLWVKKPDNSLEKLFVVWW